MTTGSALHISVDDPSLRVSPRISSATASRVSGARSAQRTITAARVRATHTTSELRKPKGLDRPVDKPTLRVSKATFTGSAARLTLDKPTLRIHRTIVTAARVACDRPSTRTNHLTTGLRPVVRPRFALNHPSLRAPIAVDDTLSFTMAVEPPTLRTAAYEPPLPEDPDLPIVGGEYVPGGVVVPPEYAPPGMSTSAQSNWRWIARIDIPTSIEVGYKLPVTIEVKVLTILTAVNWAIMRWEGGSSTTVMSSTPISEGSVFEFGATRGGAYVIVIYGNTPTPVGHCGVDVSWSNARVCPHTRSAFSSYYSGKKYVEVPASPYWIYGDMLLMVLSGYGALDPGDIPGWHHLETRFITTDGGNGLGVAGFYWQRWWGGNPYVDMSNTLWWSGSILYDSQWGVAAICSVRNWVEPTITGSMVGEGRPHNYVSPDAESGIAFSMFAASNPSSLWYGSSITSNAVGAVIADNNNSTGMSARTSTYPDGVSEMVRPAGANLSYDTIAQMMLAINSGIHTVRLGFDGVAHPDWSIGALRFGGGSGWH